MAKLAPFFLTGANAKIKMNGRTVAFCTDVSYSVQVNHATPRILGMYEPVSLEPLSYGVEGSLSIIRYVADVKDDNARNGAKTPNSVANKGNGIGSYGPDNPIARNLGNDGRVHENLNPETFQNGTFFDIEIYQKLPNGQQHAVAKIRDCRIVRADFAIAGKTAPAVERFTFKALYADEDSFLAGFSGTGQKFTT